MLDNLSVTILIGTVLGILSGLGTGGGSLLILWLTLGAGITQPEARIINLMFFIPSALIACIFRWKQGRLDIKKILPAIIAGSIASGIFSFLSQHIEIMLLKNKSNVSVAVRIKVLLFKRL